MTFILDASGRPLALLSENREAPPVPVKHCAHGVLCPACGGGR